MFRKDMTNEQPSEHSQQKESEGICVDVLHLQTVGYHHTLLLKDVSLAIPRGAFVALVGSSGVGKSTLMYAFSGLQPAQGRSVLYNEYDYYRHLSSFRTHPSCVPQEDIPHRRLPVKRALYYAARLRLPADVIEEQIHQRIDEVLTEVGMKQRRDSMISTFSGGERKRVSIALELLANPYIFFLDEPTSGLDPGWEFKMMHLLRDLADKGHIIILVTHTIMNIEVCLEPTKDQLGIPEGAEERFRASPYHERYVLAAIEQAHLEQGRQETTPLSPSAQQISGWQQFLLLSLRYLVQVFQTAITPNSGENAQTLLFIMGFVAVLVFLVNAKAPLQH